MTPQFTIEEINLMCVYRLTSRYALIQDLTEAVQNGFDTGDTEDNAEMLGIAVSALGKVTKMSDADFDALELYPIYDDETEVDE
jgi:hypothetical protein